MQQTQEGIARGKKQYVIIPLGADLSEGHGMTVLRYSAGSCNVCSLGGVRRHPVKQANAGVSPSLLKYSPSSRLSLPANRSY